MVAHEVRNPLGVIYNSMSGLKRLLTPAGEAAHLFKMIDEEAKRIDTIVADLLEFARPHAPELRDQRLGGGVAGEYVRAAPEDRPEHFEVAAEGVEEREVAEEDFIVADGGQRSGADG